MRQQKKIAFFFVIQVYYVLLDNNNNKQISSNNKKEMEGSTEAQEDLAECVRHCAIQQTVVPDAILTNK